MLAVLMSRAQAVGLCAADVGAKGNVGGRSFTYPVPAFFDVGWNE